EGQREILVRGLGWSSERVETIPSLRYRRGDTAPLAGRVLLPYAFRDEGHILSAFEHYLRTADKKSMPHWTIRNHPVRTASACHLRLVARLQDLCAKYDNRTSNEPSVANQCVLIGATASVIEALERGVSVVHICANPLFEAHTATIWVDMRVEAL